VDKGIKRKEVIIYIKRWINIIKGEEL